MDANGKQVADLTALGAVDPQVSLRNLQLLESLRAGNTSAILPLLTRYAEDAKAQPRPGSTPLHLAVRCASATTVQFIIEHASEYLNSVDARGATPLHLATTMNRKDVVALLLARDEIDDTVRDKAGNTCMEVGGAHDVTAQIMISRGHFNDSFVALLAGYIASPSPQRTSATVPASPRVAPPTPTVSAASGHVSNSSAEALYHLIARPRASILDFTAKDNATGTTVLHEAAKRNDLGLIKLVLSKGGDAMVRDRLGKVPLELAGDDRVKAVLRSATESSDARSPATSVGQLPTVRGFLSKWTNMARGYRSRWFVLENGVLSYYRNQDEEGKASRGSISMSVAVLMPSADEKPLKFELSNKLGKSYPSFWLKATHPSEATRWVDALRQSIEAAREASSLTRTGSRGSQYASSAHGGRAAYTSRYDQANPEGFGDRDGSIVGDDETFGDEECKAPRADDFELIAASTKTQIELTQQLLNSLVGPARISSNTEAQDHHDDVKEALQNSLRSVSALLTEYVDVVGQRERYFCRRYERELDIKRLWEESMREVASQHAVVEAELQRFGRDNVRKTRALQEVRANLISSPSMSPAIILDPEGEVDPLAQLTEEPVDLSLPPKLTSVSSNPRIRTLTLDGRPRARSTSLSPSRLRMRGSTVSYPLNPVELEQLVDSALNGEGNKSEEDDDDEFFEAIESGAIPLPSKPSTPLPKEPTEYLASMDLTQYKGYEHLRTKLPIDANNKPPAVSLWGILKNSIGVDLSKISLPVVFNEPTSFLQRMSEDLEFAECLDAAAGEQDATKRIAFVGAFAMSNYSSTIGRIAKPFNPLLGETFEFVDLKKKYRYVSEQVCHHPPISACIAQAASWEYFGEVDAKSKFMGKSFEIRPAGLAHVNLRIPKEWAPHLPDAPRFPGMVIEHYSWTKVTTSISNFLFGAPIIDHFGDLVVTSHRSNLKCILTFKPRGWRGSGATEIKGRVVDTDGKASWDIAGKWSSQLVARRVGYGTGDLAPDASIPASSSGETAPEYVRLWQNSDKPVGSPFNLTPFAISLNDTNEEIKAWLPPTDCRLRPDQHAFESGSYDEATKLKAMLEDHQRSTRKAREKGEKGEHRPRWFNRRTDQDTGEPFWEPTTGEEGTVEYWEERRRVGVAKKAGEDAEWKGVEAIFGGF